MTSPAGENDGGFLARARRRSVATVFVDAFLCAIGVLLIIILTLDPKRAEPPRPQYDLSLTCEGLATYVVTARKSENDPAPRRIEGLSYRDSAPLETFLTDAARAHPGLHLRLRIEETPDSAACARNTAQAARHVADALSREREDGGAVIIAERWFTPPPSLDPLASQETLDAP